MDKAGVEFWDARWTSGADASGVDPTRPGVWNHVNRTFHHLFARHVGVLGAGASVMEVGCARSFWLPYFARQFGMTVRGIDYSPLGCEQSRDVLAAAGVAGEIILADMFDPPAEVLGAQDAVISFGVVEHFDDTVAAVAACGNLLRPGGTVVTVTPNMPGVSGRVMRLVNRAAYDVHVLLTARDLADAHRDAGLEIVDSGYLVSSNLGIVNLAGLTRGTRSWQARRIAIALMLRLSVAGWWLEGRGVRVPLRPFAAGYCYCVARRPADVTP